jgi:hypothetical protein
VASRKWVVTELVRKPKDTAADAAGRRAGSARLQCWQGRSGGQICVLSSSASQRPTASKLRLGSDPTSKPACPVQSYLTRSPKPSSDFIPECSPAMSIYLPSARLPIPHFPSSSRSSLLSTHHSVEHYGSRWLFACTRSESRRPCPPLTGGA